MKFRHAKRIALLALCAAALSASDKASEFKFTKVDIDLLGQADLLDRRLEREGMVYHDAALEAYVNQIGRAMLPVGVSPERVQWQFRVLRDPMQNSFALPNGSVYVNMGLISLLENEDQLASVLAHEITHVTDRHAYLQYRDSRKKAMIASIAEVAATVASGSNSWGQAVALVASQVPAIMNAMINGYGRNLERNADIYSFNKLIEGAYDPREMPNTFLLLQRRDEANVAKTYYSDHPALSDRVTYTNSLLAAKAPKPVLPEILAARRMKYLSLTEAVSREDIRLAILSRRPRTALARAMKLVEFHPNSADNLFAAGEAHQALGPWTEHPSERELTGGGQKQIQSLKKKFTPDEEERELLSKDGGQAAWRENQGASEENYRQALAVDPRHARTYRGLGQLYEKQKRNQEALAAYRKYLELQPSALDQTRIRQRIETLQRSGGR